MQSESPIAHITPGPAQSRLLLVGKDSGLREEWRKRLRSTPWLIQEAQTGAEAFQLLLQEGCELMLLDPELPDLEAADFEALVRSHFPGLQIITLGQHSAAQIPTVRLHTSGFGPTRFTVHAVPETPAVQDEGPSSWHELVGSSTGMRSVYRAAGLVARRDTTVLIQGESGTGKDLLARSIHAASPRAKQPFVVINCAAIPDTLLEAELFGYTKGAFTGAVQSRIGRIHAAQGGTLFLDEIGDMPFPLQSKILRFLEQGEVQRIGGTDTLRIDTRVIAATNADLQAAVKAKTFREDLYYRLAIFPIALPALRDRMNDVPELVQALLRQFCPGVSITGDALRQLLAHAWPGNVRELRNVLERASIFADTRREIGPEDLSF